VLCFDGAPPAAFARKLGGLSVRFAHPRSADDLIIDLTREAREPSTVVTSDQGVANRVRRRTVAIVSAHEFATRLQGLAGESENEAEDRATGEDDWSDYFSDPKNRIF
jgi:hypothetical protein